MPSLVRLISLSVVGAVVILIMAPAIWRLTRSFDWLEASEAIEREDQRFNGRLVTVISTTTQPESLRGSAELRDILELETLKLVGAPQKRPNAFRSFSFPLIALVFLISALVAGSLLHHATAAVLFVRQMAPLADVAPATAITLRVLPGDVSRLAGEPFAVTVHMDGSADVVPILQFVLGDQPQASAMMPIATDGYTFNFAALDQSMSYRVRAGAITTPWYKVTSIRPPSVAASISMTHSATTGQSEDPAAAAYLKAIGRISPTTVPR